MGRFGVRRMAKKEEVYNLRGSIMLCGASQAMKLSTQRVIAEQLGHSRDSALQVGSLYLLSFKVQKSIRLNWSPVPCQNLNDDHARADVWESFSHSASSCQLACRFPFFFSEMRFSSSCLHVGNPQSGCVYTSYADDGRERAPSCCKVGGPFRL